jgi:hypothetical protein
LKGPARSAVVLAAAVIWSAGAAWSQTAAHAKTAAKETASATQYVISGVVVNSVDGSAVPRCHLTANPVVEGGFRRRQFPAASTNDVVADEHGHFSVMVPSAGSWRLTAKARGFVTQDYDEHRGFSSAVVLTQAAPTIDLRFRLSPEAVITGVVLDEAGEPVRNAQMMLRVVPPATPGGPQSQGATRGFASTDDRGMYEIANIAPGSYRLTVQARPWYATSPQTGGTDSASASLDPSLDFAYPLTWFPGSSDPALSETIVLHAGDTRQADFHLIPIPAIHLRIMAPRATATAEGGRMMQSFPMVQPVGGFGQGPTNMTSGSDRPGEFDVGGLTPGMYEVTMRGPNQSGHATLVEVTANSARTLDLSAPPHDMASVTIHLDGATEGDDGQGGRGGGGGLQVSLIDTDTHRGPFSSGRGGGPNFGRRDQGDEPADRVIEAPPGRYEVVLQGRQNVFITGLSAKGAEASGRYVTVPAGESTVTVHVATGRATLSGVATLKEKPCVGAMVLLVPITIEDKNSITFLREDQTNTDGSFDLTNVIPGQYILVAIDDGWEINWGDPSTLRRYLLQGVPVDLKSSAMVKQNVEAQAP